MSALIAFDAAARHASFTRAARELNVSQPAVSRRVAQLEADLGVELISRQTKPLHLTETGQKLFEALRSGLGRIEAAVLDIRNAIDPSRIEISAGSGFAAFWLIPRLSALQAAFPKCNIRIISQTHREDTAAGDIQIRFGDGVWPDTRAAKIMGEEVFAVASPIHRPAIKGFIPIAQIASHRLLNLQSARQPWYDWYGWLEALGSTTGKPLKLVEFDNYALLINATLAGQGLALCWSGLLDQLLDSGALIRVSEQSVTSSRGYFVTCRRDVAPVSSVQAIADWIASPTHGGSVQTIK
jgi:DNA-binding transcriptional LysR family regulator